MIKAKVIEQQLKSIFVRIVKKLIYFIVSIAILFLLMSVLKNVDFFKFFTFKRLPTLGNIIEYAKSQIANPNFYDNVRISLIRVVIGYFTGAVIAIFCAFLISQLKFTKVFIYTLFELMRPIPNAAWVPFSIIVFTSIEGSLLFIIFISSFFPIFINTLRGIENIHINYLKYAESIMVNKVSYIFEILFPAALPNIVTGLLLGMSGTWLGLVMAELISGQSGIGYMLWTCYTLTDYTGVVFWMIVVGVLGALSSFLINMISKKIIRW